MVEWITLPGLVNYKNGLRLMEMTVDSIIQNKAEEIVYLLEHEEVYTTGSSFRHEDLLQSSLIPVVHTNRGGKWTYHGPGQRVIYPVLNLMLPTREADVKQYVTMLEQLVINTLSQFQIKGHTVPNQVGVWIDVQGVPAKIAAIGVRIKKWVTYHGVAVNITTDLSRFEDIVPCGIQNCPITSMLALGVSISMLEFDLALYQEFRKLF